MGWLAIVVLFSRDIDYFNSLDLAQDLKDFK